MTQKQSEQSVSKVVEDDEPSVMGAACGPPAMPTEVDRRAAWRELFIAAAVKQGVLDAEMAASLFDANADGWDYSESPEDALAEEMEHWTE